MESTVIPPVGCQYIHEKRETEMYSGRETSESRNKLREREREREMSGEIEI
jgi:hypothetical protein